MRSDGDNLAQSIRLAIVNGLAVTDLPALLPALYLPVRRGQNLASLASKYPDIPNNRQTLLKPQYWERRSLERAFVRSFRGHIPHPVLK